MFFRRFFDAPAPDPDRQLQRIRYMEVYIALPVRAVVIATLFYYFFFSNWAESPISAPEITPELPPREFAVDVVRYFFLIYVVLNVGGASLLLGMRQLPVAWVERIVFGVSCFDTLFLAALTAVTDGYYSVLYWVFLGLILRNTVSTPIATRQVALNLFVTACYLVSGMVEVAVSQWEMEMVDDKVLAAMLAAMDQAGQDASTESFLLRFFLLLLMTLCGFGVQVLFDKQRRAEEEGREYAMRQEQLKAAGRLAAEIAHQLKNPLGIINNASFTLQRTVKEGKAITQQLQIIREEVERSDRILTELMGYAQLSEGKVERLDVVEEMDSAIETVFPAAASYPVAVHRDYGAALPVLLMQRGHLSEVLVNILQNAREAMLDGGNIWVRLQYGENYSVVIEIEDDGPGISMENLSNIFEPYFTTKERGTGLGLSIVRHNTEVYGGIVTVCSEIGKGTTFTVRLPAKTLMRLRQ